MFIIFNGAVIYMWLFFLSYRNPSFNSYNSKSKRYNKGIMMERACVKWNSI